MDPKPFTGSVWSREEWTVHLFSGRTPPQWPVEGYAFGFETIHRFGVVKRGMDCPPPLGSYSISVVSRGIRFGFETFTGSVWSREEWTVHLLSGRTLSQWSVEGYALDPKPFTGSVWSREEWTVHLFSGRSPPQWSVEGYALDPKPFTGSVWSREEWTVNLFSGRTPTSVVSRGIRFGFETIHRFGVVNRQYLSHDRHSGGEI